MLGFAPVSQHVTIADNSPPATFELTLLPFEEMKKIAAVSAAEGPPKGGHYDSPANKTAPVPASAPGGANAGAPRAPDAPPAPPAPELEQAAADGLLINGSVNN